MIAADSYLLNIRSFLIVRYGSPGFLEVALFCEHLN